MIVSFRCKESEKIWSGTPSRRLPESIQAIARRKLRMLDAAQSSHDLRSPPANRLEALSGDRAGQHSLRINDQWRICFRWQDAQVMDVEIVDYQ